VACGRILDEAAGGGAHHFRRLGLDSLDVFDPASAEVNYLKLSRLLHPDFQAAADNETRARALRNSARLNESWKVLNDEQLRAEHLLELHDPGVLERHKTLSPEFLMEAMEVSEQLDDARAIGCQDTLRRIAGSARTEIEERMKDVASACTSTILRIAREEQEASEGRPARLLSPHEWNTEQIAVLLHQARVYRRILRDTEHPR
jgi:molecular chaperone HscB